MGAFAISERRACSALHVPRSSPRYKSRRADCSALKRRLCEFALARPRCGHEPLWIPLRREGWLVNRKKVHTGARAACQRTLGHGLRQR